MEKTIRIYVNGKYAYTTTRYSTIREAIDNLKKSRSVTVQSIPNYSVHVTEKDTITGEIVKKERG